MNAAEALEVLLKSYRRYYNINTESPAEPFAAEAAFHSHNEQYFLVKRATLSEADSHEYVFFAAAEQLDLEQAKLLDERAWEEGMSRVRPHKNHRNTDVVLIILAERISEEARAFIRKSRHYQSYHHTLQGWSHYSMVAMELSTGEFLANRRGKDLKKFFRNIK